MSLDRIGPCLVCSTECEGWICSFACEVEHARQQDAKAEQLREEMREARAAHRARQAGRREQFTSWGPK